jgi:hypothetical protein
MNLLLFRRMVAAVPSQDVSKIQIHQVAVVL